MEPPKFKIQMKQGNYDWIGMGITVVDFNVAKEVALDRSKRYPDLLYRVVPIETTRDHPTFKNGERIL